MPSASFKPETRSAFRSAPAVVYSLIVPEYHEETNKSVPETAIEERPAIPVMNDGATSMPEVVYSEIFPPTATRRSVPDKATVGGPSPKEIKELFSVAPDVVYSPIVPPLAFATNICAKALLATPEQKTTKTIVTRCFNRGEQHMGLIPCEGRQPPVKRDIAIK
jgi:hypothetical protein